MATALKFAGRVSYFVYVLSDMVVGALVAGVVTGFVSSIGVEMLADANVNMSTSLMTALEFGLPKPLGECRC